MPTPPRSTRCRASARRPARPERPSRPRAAISGTPPIQNFWNQIAQEVALSHHSDLPTTARLFATLNLSFADSAIAFYDAKYAYQLSRAVAAIPFADTGRNPTTVADPGWLPLAGNTAADPS